MTLNETVDPAAVLVSKFHDKRVLVLGDAILDEYSSVTAAGFPRKPRYPFSG